MKPCFVVWSTDLGQTEKFGSTKITGVSYDAQGAAEQWAHERDRNSAEYRIAGKGETCLVTVRDCATGDITEWEVSGDCEPVYWAHKMSFKKTIEKDEQPKGHK